MILHELAVLAPASTHSGTENSGPRLGSIPSTTTSSSFVSFVDKPPKKRRLPPSLLQPTPQVMQVRCNRLLWSAVALQAPSALWSEAMKRLEWKPSTTKTP